MNFSLSFHPLFVLMCCGFIYFGFLGLLASYLFCLIVHELCHSLMAYKLGYKLTNIKLMPHGVSLSGNNVYFSYKDEIKIALAGPLSNFVFIVLILALWWIFPSSYAYTHDLYIANLAIGVVNLLPIYPLDGGRVLLALLSQRTSRLHALRILKVLGIILSSAIIISFAITAFFAPNVTLLFFGVFLFVTSLTETKNIQYARVNNLEYKISRINKGIALRNVAVNEDVTLYKLYSQITPFSLTNFTVLDSNLKIVAQISEKQLQKLVLIYPSNAKLSVILSQMLA